MGADWVRKVRGCGDALFLARVIIRFLTLTLALGQGAKRELN